MKCFNRSLQLAMLATTTCAFTPVSFRQQSLQISSQIPVAQNKVQSILFSSQWDDDDDDDAVVQTRTSYDDAGETLRNAEDQDKVDGMEDFDANPAVRSSTPYVPYTCIICLVLSFLILYFVMIYSTRKRISTA